MPAYYLRISYGMSDVCSSDLPVPALPPPSYDPPPTPPAPPRTSSGAILVVDASQPQPSADRAAPAGESRSLSPLGATAMRSRAGSMSNRSEEHTSELQSLMRNSYAVFCLKNKTNHNHIN